ncbi:MAG: fluoride efflux transporter FluC [Actinomycetales bacterium]
MSTYLATGILVMLGGALGAGCRYLVAEAVRAWLPPSDAARVPWATTIVNVAGSFLLGVVTGLAGLQAVGGPAGAALLGVGFCGGFTTFSTFAVDCVSLFSARAARALSTYLAINVVAGCAAAAAGLWLSVTLG